MKLGQGFHAPDYVSHVWPQILSKLKRRNKRIVVGSQISFVSVFPNTIDLHVTKICYMIRYLHKLLHGNEIVSILYNELD